MTRVLIIEPDSAVAQRFSAALVHGKSTIVSNLAGASAVILAETVDVGIASSSVFIANPLTPELRIIPWVVLIDSVDDELAVHHKYPNLNAGFLHRDPQFRYLDVLPLRIRMSTGRDRVIATIADRFPGMVAYWDTNEHCHFANAAYREWTGLSHRDILNQKPLREVLGESYPMKEPYIRAALRGETQVFERSSRSFADGQLHRILVTYTPDIYEGEVRGFVVIITWMDEQYRLREALLERERRWATLFDILPVGVTVLDGQGKVMEQNPAILSMLGLDRQALERGDDRQRSYVHPDGQPLACEDFPSSRALRERRVVGPVEIGILCNDGPMIWTSVSAAPSPEEDAVVVVTRDITEEKTSAARFEAIVDASPIPYAFCDKRGEITYVNPAFTAAFGYTREDIPSIDAWMTLLFPEPTHRHVIQEKWRAKLRTSKRDRVPFDPVEVTFRAKNGEKKLVMAGPSPLAGKWTGGYLIVAIDVTERRNTERQLEESQRLAALGALSGGIAHDFNNLLMPIVTNVELALADLPEGSLLTTNLSEIRVAADRAAALVRQILAMSRPGDESKTRVDLAPLIEEVIRILQVSMPPSISIRTQIERNAPCVFANSTRIHRIILNLATNARDAMKTTGGILTISLARTQDNQLKLSVADMGVGIEPALMERIFEPYFSTRVSSGGTGLGLSTVRTIVTALGGTLEIHSEPGKGTTVDVLLPALPTQQADFKMRSVAVERDSTPLRSRGQHILVVDDETLVTRAAARMLSRMGYRVSIATSATTARDMFQADPTIAAVITDHTMPDMTGLDLAKELYAMRATPILLATGYAEHLTAETLREAHVLQLLSKPYSMAALAKALGSILPDPD